MNRERLPLLFKDVNSDLSLLFATLCVIDIFGIFPIIALPRSIVQCGLYGIPLVFIVLTLQIYTAILLGKSWIIATTIDPQILRKNRNPLAAVTELTLGSRARNLITIILDLTVFGCTIPNLLVASQNLQIFGLKISGQQFNLSFCYWLLIIGILLCPIMWLGSPRDMKIISLFSCTMLLLIALLIWWCIITDTRELDIIPIPTSPSWDKFISSYGMLAFQFDIHPTLMTVQVDMRHPQDINKAVIISFLVTGSLFLVTTILAVWKYGSNITANILQLIPGNFTMSIVVLIAALQLCLSSVLSHSTLFQDLEDQCNIKRNFGWKRCLIRSAIVFLGVAVGESVPRFDIVMVLIGGSLTGLLVFVFPPLLYSKIIALKTRSKKIRSLIPEVYSSSERCQSSKDMPINPRIHSKSIYYGVLSVPRSEYHRYSYVYYNELENELDKIVDYENDIIDSEKFLMIKRIYDNKPIFIDASQSYNIYKQIIIPEESISESTTYNYKMWSNCFSYLIVFFGIIITISSTYINMKNTIHYVQFTSPCIMNVTILQNSV
ncbi:proton-coupled amino acid transporter 4 isoform X1 [Apis mellifera]|uniref:Proton-coupled amino acid transporter 4 isoform X1 n=1 Tax=Apis mellifera TaxID=7460 RepID=A0A7M7R8P7_APIME|nr:proton-coupled amino acid transporter 4 isoform X1 [Apis mellifera]|eukprot:XP_395531.2 proton-coupled amino acid transporter 4 isoform X1 [Apis mellifera]